jgi:hypothetical protein
MTESAPADPHPFHRFPWVQLAFCLACLAMAAWTWMRCSYAWDVTPEDITEMVFDGTSWLALRKPPEESPFYGRYVILRGRIFEETATWPEGSLTHLGLVWSYGDPPASVGVSLRADHGLRPRTPLAIAGRVGRLGAGDSYAKICVDAQASRFHPESIAGLIVGAMGCFIFSLYLRRWLRERRAT